VYLAAIGASMVLGLVPFIGSLAAAIVVYPFMLTYLTSMYFRARGEGALVDAAIVPAGSWQPAGTPPYSQTATPYTPTAAPPAPPVVPPPPGQPAAEYLPAAPPLPPAAHELPPAAHEVPPAQPAAPEAPTPPPPPGTTT
ncbi:MAG: hypothetical protein WCN81_13755, partial [Actinomycetes bacterium]